MRELTKDEFLEILYEMGRRVGCPKKFFEPYRRGKKMPSNWFEKYSWTDEQENDFRLWLARHLKRKLGMSLKYWQIAIPWFLLDYGWRVK